MRAVVLAYHEMGCAGLEALRDAGAEVLAVFTHVDDPQEKRWFRSVADLAGELRIPVLSPDRINAGECVEQIRALEPEMLFSFYYRQIVSREILDIPPRGCFNLHGSLLPRYRGRSPTNWAILEGETRTGVTLHEMEARADTGAILAQREVPIGQDDDARTVLLAQVNAARAMLAELLPRLDAGTAPRTPQDEQLATTFGGRRPQDGEIDWSSSARQVHDLVRAVADPFPGAFSRLAGQKCMIWKARYEKGRPSRDEAAPGSLLAATADGVLVRCGTETVEVLRAEIPPGPRLDGEELHSMFGPIPGPGFSRGGA